MTEFERDYELALAALKARQRAAVKEQAGIERLGRKVAALEKRREQAKRAVKKAPPVPEDVTLTAEEVRKWSTLSRASRWQLVQVKQGRCAICGKEPLVSSRLGAKCLAKQRERMRKKTGAKRRNSALSYSLETRG